MRVAQVFPCSGIPERGSVSLCKFFFSPLIDDPFCRARVIFWLLPPNLGRNIGDNPYHYRYEVSLMSEGKTLRAAESRSPVRERNSEDSN